MRKTVFATITLVTVLLFSGYRVAAQPAPMASPDRFAHHDMMKPHHDPFGIPNLTDEQKAKIKDLRLATYKETKVFKNQLGELNARKRTLESADKADFKAIDANIDEIARVKASIMKARAHFKQQVRALLTDEQRLAFDMHSEKHNFHRGHGFTPGHEFGAVQPFEKEEWHENFNTPDGMEGQK